jgi:hypothetical protein
MGNTFIRASGNKLGIGTSNPLGVLSIGLGSSLSSLATYSSIEPLGIFNMFYTNSGTYPFYLDIAAIGDTMPGGSTGGSNIRFLTHCGTANAMPVERMRITNCGHVQPGVNGTQDFGSTSLRWRTVYTSDLSLSNGTGDYTIVEGENDLFLYNNKQCKVYKFMLEQVCAECATPKKI